MLNDGLAWGARAFGASRNLPLPIWLGLGLLPVPFKLVHHIGAPILPHPKRGETADQTVERLRAETEAAMTELLGR